MQGKEENNLLSLVLQIVMYEVRREERSRRSGSRDGRRGTRSGKRGNREWQNIYYLSQPLALRSYLAPLTCC